MRLDGHTVELRGRSRSIRRDENADLVGFEAENLPRVRSKAISDLLLSVGLSHLCAWLGCLEAFLRPDSDRMNARSAPAATPDLRVIVLSIVLDFVPLFSTLLTEVSGEPIDVVSRRAFVFQTPFAFHGWIALRWIVGSIQSFAPCENANTGCWLSVTNR